MHSLILGTNIKFILIRMPILTHIARGSKLRQKAACGGTAHYFPLFSLFPPQVNLFGLCQLWCQSSVLWKGMLWRGSLYYIKFKHSSCIIYSSCKAGGWNMAGFIKGSCFFFRSPPNSELLCGHPSAWPHCVISVALTPPTLITDNW